VYPPLRPTPEGSGSERDFKHNAKKRKPTLNTSTMKKTLKKLSLGLAFVLFFFASACSEIDVTPQSGGEDDDTPIIIPPKPRPNSVTDSLQIG
jgi:hypothetical protein